MRGRQGSSCCILRTRNRTTLCTATQSLRRDRARNAPCIQSRPALSLPFHSAEGGTLTRRLTELGHEVLLSNAGCKGESCLVGGRLATNSVPRANGRVDGWRSQRTGSVHDHRTDDKRSADNGGDAQLAVGYSRR